MNHYEIKTIRYCHMEILILKLLKNVNTEEREDILNLFKMSSETIPADSNLILNLFRKYQREIDQTPVTIENLEWWQKFREQHFGTKNFFNLFSKN